MPEKTNFDRPLVTVALLAYRQERFIREAVRSVLSQTYEPLEIIISDDNSPDETWNLIVDEVDRYKKAGGVHKNIVVRRNDRNMGIAAHHNTLTPLVHGELRIDHAGDDVSMPNRVEEIVKAWLSCDRKATIIQHDARLINIDGLEVGFRHADAALHPCGAVTAYATKVFSLFGDIPSCVKIEDVIWTFRAFMAGEFMVLHRPLLCYRIGAGFSSGGAKSKRHSWSQNAKACLLSYEVVREDARRMAGRFPIERIDKALLAVQQEASRAQAEWDLVCGETFSRRYHALGVAIKNGLLNPRSKTFWCKDWMYLLPPSVGTPLMNLMDSLLEFARDHLG